MTVIGQFFEADLCVFFAKFKKNADGLGVKPVAIEFGKVVWLKIVGKIDIGLNLELYSFFFFWGDFFICFNELKSIVIFCL